WPSSLATSRALPRSHNRSDRSYDHDRTQRPSSDTWQPATLSWCPAKVFCSRFCWFQRITLRSHEEVAIQWPSALKVIAEIGRLWARKVLPAWNEPASQKASIPSRVPETRRLPSGETAQADTGLLLTWISAACAPVRTSHRRSFPSQPPETTWRWSGVKAHASVSSPCVSSPAAEFNKRSVGTENPLYGTLTHPSRG